MPNAIPTSAISLAIDGVLIQASCLDHATRADRLERQAQRRARQLTDTAAREADALRRQALEQGYLDGMSEAIAVVVGSACATRAVGSSLVDRALERATDRIRDALRESGMEEELLVKYCVADRGAPEEVAVLRMPQAGTFLAERLKARLADRDIEIRLEAITNPVLDLGHTAYEFVVEEAVISHAMAESALSESHHASLRRMASSYAAETITAMAARRRCDNPEGIL